jgi:predicted kinase
MVCGAPGSGKTTYVRSNAKPGDTIIDMDDIRESLGCKRYSNDWRHLRHTMRERDRMILSLSSRTEGEAWLIVGAPTDRERQLWMQALGSVTLHSMDTSAAECMRRIANDPTREGQRERLMVAVDRYFSRRLGITRAVRVVA